MSGFRTVILLLFLAVWLPACAPALRSDHAYTLAYGNELKFRTQAFRKEVLHFQGVTEDSRCPTGANCIQAGRALVQLGVGDSSFVLEEGQGIVHGRCSIFLQSVLPYPNVADTQAARQSQYRINLILVKADSRAH